MPNSKARNATPTDDAPTEQGDQTETHESTPSHNQQSDVVTAAVDETIETEWEDIVDLTSDDSFPASDPPTWATGQKRDKREP